MVRAALPYLGTLAAISIASGVGLAYLAFVHNPAGTLTEQIAYCNSPDRLSFVTDGYIPPLNNFFCVKAPYIQELISEPVGVSLNALLVGAWISVLVRLTYISVTPNTRSTFFGILPPILAGILGQLLGIGFVVCIIVVPLYSMGAYRHLVRIRTSTSEQSFSSAIPLPPLPARAHSIYLANIAVLLSILCLAAPFLFSLSQDVSSQHPTFEDPSSWGWWTPIHILSQTYSVVLILLLPIAAWGIHSPKNHADANTELLRLDTEQMSYGFERTWGYYRKFALLALIFHWFGLARLFKSIHEHGVGGTLDVFLWSNPSFFFLCSYAAIFSAMLLILIVERLTFRSRANYHPLLPDNPSRPLLDIACQRAIETAPAGDPILERNIFAQLLLAPIAGPGFILALWWASEQEELGWKARKAWREADAIAREKKD